MQNTKQKISKYQSVELYKKNKARTSSPAMCLLWTATVSSVPFATMAGTSMQPQWFAGMTYTLNVMTLNPSKMSSTIQTAGIYRGTPVVLVAFRGSQTSCFLHGWNALHWEGGAPAGLRLQQPWWLLRLWWCCRCICLQNLKSQELQKHFVRCGLQQCAPPWKLCWATR